MENTATKTASLLLQINAIKLQPQNPFTWSSGWKSPIYCDNRISLSFPEIRNFIKENLSELVKNKFGDAEIIAGVATAGIAHAALMADYLNMPMCYVRSSLKNHGMGNLIEGQILKGQKVVVVEDLISTGGSSLNVVHALRDAGCEVLGMVAIFTYGFQSAADKFKEANCQYYTLTDYFQLIEEALQQKIISENEIETLKKWREAPDVWNAP